MKRNPFIHLGIIFILLFSVLVIGKSDAQLISSGSSTGGPSSNVTLNVLAYGASGSLQTTTGTINSGQNTLTLAAAQDFKSGQGIEIDHGGNHCTFANGGGLCSSSTSPTPTVAVVGSAGAVTETYEIACMDGNTTGANPYSLGGLAAVGSSGTTSTSQAVASMSVNNYNHITWTDCTDHLAAVYRQDAGAGSFKLIAVTDTNSLDDTGYYQVTWTNGNPVSTSSALIGMPIWVPATAPALAVSDNLITTITSGAGTTSLTLAATASTNVASGNVHHSEDAAFAAVSTALTGVNSGNVFIPQGVYNLFKPWSVPSSTHITGVGHTQDFNGTFGSYIYSQVDGDSLIYLADPVETYEIHGQLNSLMLAHFAVGGRTVLLSACGSDNSFNNAWLMGGNIGVSDGFLGGRCGEFNVFNNVHVHGSLTNFQMEGQQDMWYGGSAGSYTEATDWQTTNTFVDCTGAGAATAFYISSQLNGIKVQAFKACKMNVFESLSSGGTSWATAAKVFAGTNAAYNIMRGPSFITQLSDGAPTYALNGCGTIAAGSATGSDWNGRVTTGTTTTTCTISFGHTWQTAPNCICEDETTSADFTKCSATTGVLTITTASNTGDVLKWQCSANGSTF